MYNIQKMYKYYIIIRLEGNIVIIISNPLGMISLPRI